MFKFILILLLSSIALSSFARTAYIPPIQTEKDFQLWLTDFKKTAYTKGISSKTIRIAFKDTQLDPSILELDRKQPEFFSGFWKYFARATSEWRIEKGQKLYKENLTQLSKITKKYGIPERILVSFWGLETNYGGYTGTTPIIEALATLSYDLRRRDFFSTELIAALKIIDKGYVQASEMKGSWAGAMGQCQFMPSNYLRYAVDGDMDNKKDLWNSKPDIFNSMGNFLKRLGWKRNGQWANEVILPTNFNYALADGSTSYSLEKWQQLGIKIINSTDLNKNNQAKLILATDYQGPAFLVYDNFFIIKRWNNSTKYALAVGHLADRIIGKSALSKSAPKIELKISREQTKELQQKLMGKGYELGGADGIAGSKTRKAIRDYQIKQNLPADGYPSLRMLKILRDN